MSEFEMQLIIKGNPDVVALWQQGDDLYKQSASNHAEAWEKFWIPAYRLIQERYVGEEEAGPWYERWYPIYHLWLKNEGRNPGW